MAAFDGHNLAAFFLALGLLLLAGRGCGELARSCKQPAVVGEILAGIALGPTLLGRLWPNLQQIFALEGAYAPVLAGFGQVAVVLLLFVAGTEVRLSSLARQGKVAACVSVAGILVPWSSGFAAATWLGGWMGRPDGVPPHLFALFFATAMSISAMAVIARTLMDIHLFRSDLGMTIMAAAVCEDFVGWSIFAAVLSLLGEAPGTRPVWSVVALTLGYAALLLTLGRKALHRLLPYLLAHSHFPQGLLAAMLAVAFLSAAITAQLGVHAVFGAFLAGVALADAPHMRRKAQNTLRELVESFFAPLFFTSIGLRLDFTAHFRLPLVLAVLALATFGKVVGCSLGARLGGLGGRQALAIGFGMNARGSMEIILGLVGLAHGIVHEDLFVALVIMTVVTAAASGPLMQQLLGRPKKRAFTDFLREGAFVPSLRAQSREQAIAELCARLATAAHLDADSVGQAVLQRERAAGTGIGGGLAIPHARLAGLSAPLVAVGVSRTGIDFASVDGGLAYLVFVVLTPAEDEDIQLAIVADVVQSFGQRDLVQAARRTDGVTDFLALVRTREGPRPAD